MRTTQNLQFSLNLEQTEPVSNVRRHESLQKRVRLKAASKRRQQWLLRSKKR